MISHLKLVEPCNENRQVAPGRVAKVGANADMRSWEYLTPTPRSSSGCPMSSQTIRVPRIISFTATTRRRLPTSGCQRRSAIQTSRLQSHMRCTCPRISLHESANGRTRLPPIAFPPKRDSVTPRRRSVQALCGTSRCMRWITWNMPICRPVRTLMLSAFCQLTSYQKATPSSLAAAYAIAAIPARYAVERQNWAEARSSILPADSVPLERVSLDRADDHLRAGAWHCAHG